MTANPVDLKNNFLTVGGPHHGLRGLVVITPRWRSGKRIKFKGSVKDHSESRGIAAWK